MSIGMQAYGKRIVFEAQMAKNVVMLMAAENVQMSQKKIICQCALFEHVLSATISV